MKQVYHVDVWCAPENPLIFSGTFVRNKTSEKYFSEAVPQLYSTDWTISKISPESPAAIKSYSIILLIEIFLYSKWCKQNKVWTKKRRWWVEVGHGEGTCGYQMEWSKSWKHFNGWSQWHTWKYLHLLDWWLPFLPLLSSPGGFSWEWLPSFPLKYKWSFPYFVSKLTRCLKYSE